MKSPITILKTISLLLFSTTMANAQSIDYSAYESLFGEPVTTSANGTPQRLSDVALDMSIITAEDIKRSPATNIPELLRFEPGINVVQSYAGHYDVSIRGYNQGFAERILVLINGRQVYLDVYGFVNWDLLPVQIDEIKQIEIVKGPNTALFGFNAVSGVINIITYNPLYDDINSVSASAGSQSYIKGSGVTTIKPNDKIGVRLSAGAHKIDDTFHQPIDVTEDGIQKDNNYSQTASANIAVQLTDKMQWDSELAASSALTNHLAFSYAPASTDNKTFSLKTSVLADTNIGLIEGKIYHNHHVADWIVSDKANPASRPSFLSKNQVTVVSLSDTLKIGTDHIFRISGEHRYNKLYIPDYDIDSGIKYNINSLSGLWNWTATPKWTFNIAGRYDFLSLDRGGQPVGSSPFSADDFNNHLHEFSYNLGAVYNPTINDSLRFIISRGIDIPSLVELGIQLPLAGGAGILVGNPYIDASIVDNYEVAFNHEIPEMATQLGAAIFYQKTSDHQDNFRNSPVVYIYDNGKDSDMVGFELSMEKIVNNNWNIGANYTFVSIDDDTEALLHYDENTPKHIFNIKLGYQTEEWFAQLNTSYRSQNFAEREHPTPGTENELYEVHDQVLFAAKAQYNINDSMNISINGLTSLGEYEQSSLGENDSRLWTELKINF